MGKIFRFKVFRILENALVELFLPTFLWVFDVHGCVLFIHTIFISILCALGEELSLTESNQLICDFSKSTSTKVLFLKSKDIVELYKENFWYQWVIHLI